MTLNSYADANPGGEIVSRLKVKVLSQITLLMHLVDDLIIIWSLFSIIYTLTRAQMTHMQAFTADFIRNYARLSACGRIYRRATLRKRCFLNFHVVNNYMCSLCDLYMNTF